ncbi:GTP-binding protein 2 isoform X2 [Anopheles cruzii]|nr:GTP-binding protein 2 isoform X2 [Anopheles cruzii]XP_052861171.1 GTP-binding protein 2 isoform X2 [Anopheles cruzii]XP_052861172.1 GTP-binding protein 2 isoform X2 [Anopheles cruzii]XP_052861173.1 GTP-binding protein 2 isoform X2 [Anopheles cruzii]XP_052861174.1 GTP-binding protein 2 isoform X2 [Anopheles cruzii]
MGSFFDLFDPSPTAESECDADTRNDNGEEDSSDDSGSFGDSSVSHLLHHTPDGTGSSELILKGIDFSRGFLPPEPQLGNIEYKLKLINPSKQRFEHLVTQMKWRLREGNGEAIYEIGVSDSGHLHGLSDSDMSVSLHTLNQMARKLDASTSVLRRKSLPDDRSVVEVLVRKIPDDQHNIEVRVAVLGGADAGKSTLLGVLTQGEFDNGQGRARLNMFRHMHEIQTGRTSCISHETLGFDAQGSVINYKYNEMMTAEEISDRSTKLVTFMDLAGHRRYLKTTVQALSGYCPGHALIVISAGNISTMTREHLAIVHALDISFSIIVTKIDLAPPEPVLFELKNLLTSIGYRKIPYLISNEDDVLNANAHQSAEQIVPIFCVSNVTGEGLDLLIKYLYVLSPGISNAEKERLEQEALEFQIDEIFRVAEVGLVAGGLLGKGVLTENSQVKVGPLQDGSFFSVVVQTIHRNKAPCRVVRAGQSASLSFNALEPMPPLRSGMVILPDYESDDIACGCYFFQAHVSVLFHATRIFKGFQTTVHIGSIRQTAIIEGIMGAGETGIGTNQTASVLFRFVRHPEYVRPGMRILFREGTSKGIGKVTQVFPLKKPHSNSET